MGSVQTGAPVLCRHTRSSKLFERIMRLLYVIMSYVCPICVSVGVMSQRVADIVRSLRWIVSLIRLHHVSCVAVRCGSCPLAGHSRMTHVCIVRCYPERIMQRTIATEQLDTHRSTASCVTAQQAQHRAHDSKQHAVATT